MTLALRDLSDAERLAWLRLIRSENIGPRTFSGLLGRFGSAAAALEALPDVARWSRSSRAVKLCTLAEAERELESAGRLGVRFIALCEAAYPAGLRAIDAPPPLLGVKGNAEVLLRPTVAIVGSRNASGSGLVFAERIAKGLASAGYVVVSGLARGIDVKAHQGSLDTGTVAVLAGGHDRIYPSEHEGFAGRLARNGALVSEMPIGWEPRARDFPRRNRLVSGLSLGVVVVEASRRSGSLITARFANEQGREVFAVPGSPLDARSEGTNDLIRQGATLCTSAEDVIAALEPVLGQPRGFPSLSEAPGLAPDAEPLWEELDLFAEEAASFVPAPTLEIGDEPKASPVATRGSEIADPSDLDRVLELLGPTPISADDLVRASGMEARTLRAALVELELLGRIRRLDGDRISLALEPSASPRAP